MIYCVVPQELAPELYDKMSEYYADDPHVTVIVDRRRAERRRQAVAAAAAEAETPARVLRDRRRMRITGSFPPIPDDPEE